MAQKLILCEGRPGTDLLEREPLASIIAGGYEVTSISGYASVDNHQMCLVLLAEPAEQASDDNTEPSDNTEPGDNTEPTDDTEP